MKDFLDYIRYKKGTICLFLGLLAIFDSGLFLYDSNIEVFLYVDTLALVFFLIYLFFSYQKFKTKIRILKEAKEKIMLEDMMLDDPSKIDDLYLAIIEDLKDLVKEDRDERSSMYREMIDYYTLWAHQIKTPIAALKLLLAQSNDTKIKIEVLKIESYVEMVMTYLKLNEDSKDYVFEKVSLAKVIKEEIRYHSTIFIYKKIEVSYDGIDVYVLSDEKWLAFIISQIISNALKYTNSGGHIKISYRDERLMIADDGIGIRKEDLPLVFEKGYSGTVGREDKRASGIGLYLTKKLCDILGIKITIDSKLDEGTIVTLTFNNKSKTFE